MTYKWRGVVQAVAVGSCLMVLVGCPPKSSTTPAKPAGADNTSPTTGEKPSGDSNASPSVRAGRRRRTGCGT